MIKFFLKLIVKLQLQHKKSFRYYRNFLVRSNSNINDNIHNK